MKDRVSLGLISGTIAGLTMNLLDWAGYLLGLYQERLLDWGAVLIYGRLPVSTLEVIFAQLGQLVFSGFIGILFTFLLVKLASGNLLVKGWVFSMFIWFGSYALSIAIQLPFLNKHSLKASVSHFISASVYGLVLAVILNQLEKRSNIE